VSSNILSRVDLKYYQERVQLLSLPYLPEPNKTFDVVKVIDELDRHRLPKDARILDMGAYQSATLWALHKLGYRKLYGVDLNPDVYNMPFYTHIRYSVADMRNTHFPGNFFDVCLALSSIEHMPDALDQFLEESARILRNGGLLIITTDFAFEKVDTKHIRPFGMNWTIFSLEEINRLILSANRHGFTLVSGVPERREIEYPIYWNNRNYTFILLVFKLSKPVIHKTYKAAILYQGQLGVHDGIYEYSRVLARRLNLPLYGDKEEIPQNINTVIIETEAQLFANISRMQFEKSKRWFLDCHSLGREMIVWLNKNSHITPIVRGSYLLTLIEQEKYLRLMNRARKLFPLVYRFIRSNRKIAKFLSDLLLKDAPKLSRYVVAPHILYDEHTPMYQEAGKKELCIGSFGFAFRFKHFDEIAKLAKRLGVKAMIIATINNTSETILNETQSVSRELARYESENVKIVTGYLNEEEILACLRDCTHVVFAQDDRPQTSGSMRFASRLGVPIISVDSFQALEAGCLRVKTLNDITKEYLEKTANERINMDDGLDYYKAILDFQQ